VKLTEDTLVQQTTADYLRDRLLGTTECVSVDPNGDAGDDFSESPSLSGDGNQVAFHSNATNLVAGDTNHWCDIFVRDRAAATTTRVSVDAAGNEADFFSVRPVISADGRVVAFESLAANLVPGDTNSSVDLFLHALVTGYTERISVDSNGRQSECSSENVSLSGDGRTAVFDSSAASLVASDANDVDDVFVHTTAALPAAWANYDAGFPGTYGVPTITSRDLPILVEAYRRAEAGRKRAGTQQLRRPMGTTRRTGAERPSIQRSIGTQAARPRSATPKGKNVVAPTVPR
jgi:hypothetical protein